MLDKIKIPWSNWYFIDTRGIVSNSDWDELDLYAQAENRKPRLSVSFLIEWFDQRLFKEMTWSEVKLKEKQWEAIIQAFSVSPAKIVAYLFPDKISNHLDKRSFTNPILKPIDGNKMNVSVNNLERVEGNLLWSVRKLLNFWIRENVVIARFVYWWDNDFNTWTNRKNYRDKVSREKKGMSINEEKKLINNIILDYELMQHSDEVVLEKYALSWLTKQYLLNYRLSKK